MLQISGEVRAPADHIANSLNRYLAKISKEKGQSFFSVLNQLFTFLSSSSKYSKYALPDFMRWRNRLS